MMNIKEITLLSREEYFEYQHLIPVVPGWWWLKSSSSAFQVYYVLQKYVQNISVNNPYGNIRPALVVEELNTPPGEKIHLFDFTWTVLDKHLLLCDSYIGHSHFDLKTNNWKTSYLKGWLETWCVRLCSKKQYCVLIKNETEFLLFQSFCNKNNKKIEPEPDCRIYKDYILTYALSKPFYFQYNLYKKKIFPINFTVETDTVLSFEEFCDYITKENNYEN